MSEPLNPSDRIRAASYGMTDEAVMRLPKSVVMALLAEISFLKTGKSDNDFRKAMVAHALAEAERMFNARAQQVAEEWSLRLIRADLQAKAADAVMSRWSGVIWAFLMAGAATGFAKGILDLMGMLP